MLGLRSTWPSLDLRDDTFRNTGLCRFRFNLHAKEDEVGICARSCITLLCVVVYMYSTYR